MRYAVVNAGPKSSAYGPDLPKRVATEATFAEVEEQIRAAIGFRLEGDEADGYAVPEPKSRAMMSSADRLS